MTTEQPRPEQEHIRNLVSELEEYKQTCIHKEMCKWMCTALKCPFHLISPLTQEEKEEKFVTDAITFACEQHDEKIRQDEREKIIDEILSLINKNCFELEGKRLKITPLLLCKEIESLRTKPEGTP